MLLLMCKKWLYLPGKINIIFVNKREFNVFQELNYFRYPRTDIKQKVPFC